MKGLGAAPPYHAQPERPPAIVGVKTLDILLRLQQNQHFLVGLRDLDAAPVANLQRHSVEVVVEVKIGVRNHSTLARRALPKVQICHIDPFCAGSQRLTCIQPDRHFREVNSDQPDPQQHACRQRRKP